MAVFFWGTGSGNSGGSVGFVGIGRGYGCLFGRRVGSYR